MNNLPPGVTDSMIPGNRPEDERMQRVFEARGDEARQEAIHKRFSRGTRQPNIGMLLETLLNDPYDALSWQRFRQASAMKDECEIGMCWIDALERIAADWVDHTTAGQHLVSDILHEYAEEER